MKSIYVCFLVITIISYGNQAFSRDKDKLSKKFQDTLTMVIEDVESVIDPDWFVVRNDSGFTLYYCRTCQERWQYYRSHLFDEQDSVIEQISGYPSLSRADFLNFYGPDSVHHRNVVSVVRAPYDSSLTVQQKFPLNGILKLDVYFQNQWSSQKFEEIKAINDSIKNCILSKYTKVNEYDYLDYRYYIETTFREQCDYEGFQMRRLPYHSGWYNYAIFIEFEPKLMFRHTYFIHPDAIAFDSELNQNLESLIERTMRTLAFTMGINDFKTLMECRQNNKRRFQKLKYSR